MQQTPLSEEHQRCLRHCLLVLSGCNIVCSTVKHMPCPTPGNAFMHLYSGLKVHNVLLYSTLLTFWAQFMSSPILAHTVADHAQTATWFLQRVLRCACVLGGRMQTGREWGLGRTESVPQICDRRQKLCMLFALCWQQYTHACTMYTPIAINRNQSAFSMQASKCTAAPLHLCHAMLPSNSNTQCIATPCRVCQAWVIAN